MASPTHSDFDDIKLFKVTERLLGRGLCSSFSHDIIYTDGDLITEDIILDILNRLMRLTRNGGWIIILYKADINTIIDGNIWKNGTITYSYDEAERYEIMARCARSIKYRMEQYTGENHISYKIFQNGNIGFRYV